MGEKTKGGKWHIVVDVLGCLLSVNVHVANVHDTKSGIIVAKQAFEKYPSIKKFCADAGYRGTFINDIKNQISLDVDISEKIKPHSWQNIPWRWVVERTFSWLNHSRHLSKDYEISSTSSITMIIISHIHTLLCRLWIQILSLIFRSESEEELEERFLGKRELEWILWKPW